MWVRVSKEETERLARMAAAKARRYDWLSPIVVGLTLAALVFSTRYFDHASARKARISTYYEGQPAAVAIRDTPPAFVIGFALAWGLRHLTRKLGPSPRAHTIMCDRCNHVMSNDGRVTCECGGNMDDLQNWRWVEEASS